MADIKDSPAYQYATWCVQETERMAPHYVKLQAASWLRIADGEDTEAYVDEERYEKITRLLRIIIHPDLKRPMLESMEGYEWLLIVATLCTMCREGTTYYEETEADFQTLRIRYYVTALLEVARKNFKTFASAVIIIILMLTEPSFSRFFSVGPDLALSSELKNAIRKIIKSSPALCDEIEPAFKLLRSEIRCTINDSEYTPLAYSRDRMDGRMAHAFLADEAGAMDDYPVEAMRSSQINLPSKLGIIISTQYPNDNNVMLTEIDLAKKTLDGLTYDRRYFSLLYEPDDDLKTGDTWQTDDRVLYQSNPVAVDHKYLLTELKKKRSLAVLYDSKRENFLCKHCNILYKGLGVEGFVDIQKVRLCRDDVPDSWWQGKPVYLGLDLSQTDDNTSVAMVCEVNGKIYAKVVGFVPAARVDLKTSKEKVDYRDLIKRGECFACGDETIDYGFVEDYILHLQSCYGVVIQQLAYDRYNALSTVQKLEAAQIECVEVKQHSSVLHMPTKLLMEAILNRRFAYAENLMLEINFQNARCTRDTNGNMYVNKKRSAAKVDMVVSLINALYLLQQEQLYGTDFVVQM